MARDRANINTAIWTSEEFRDLPGDQQLLYFILTTHPKLSYVGVVDWREARIAAMTADASPQSVRKAAEGLQAARFVFIEDETEEILVRSFMRHDGLLKQPKLSISMVNAYAEIASKRVREVVTFELQRLHQEFPEWAAFRQEKVMALVKGKGTDMGEFTQGFTPQLTLPVTQEFTLNADQADPLHTTTATTTTTPTDVGGSGGNRKRERPIPAGWAPTSAHIEYAKQRNLDLEGEAERFRLHAASHDRRLRDWDAGFRMWLTKATPQQTTASPWSKEFHQ